MPQFGIGYSDICHIKDFDMVEIHTLSAADFKHTMKSNDLYDCNIEQRTDVAVISIANSSEDSEPDDIFSNGPSSRWFRQRHRNVLNLIFDDVSASGTEPLAGSSDGDGYVLFDESMAREIVAFVEANKDASVWIVHCSAGVSRSGAVSRWLKDRLEFKYGIEANNVDGRHAVPNAYVLEVLDRMLYL